MSLCSRRSFLQTVGVTALSASLAGCSALDTGPVGVVLGNVVIQNANTESRTVRLELVRDGVLVYEATHTVDGGTERVGTVAVVEAVWSAAPATYELSYVVRESETLDVVTVPITAESVDSEYECAVPTLTLGFPEASTVELAILGSQPGTGRYCPTAQTTSDRNSQDSTTSPS
jgi:hypothetical protein